MKEPFLEPILRKMRIRRVLPVLARFPACDLLDVGCGWDARLLRSIEPLIGRGTGIDQKAPELASAKLNIVRARLDDRLPFADGSFDVVTILAVLEHLDDPHSILREIRRVLRPNGALVVTVPSHFAKPVLEFLAYKLGIVNADEVRDHKRYFGRRDLDTLFRQCGLRMESHRYFQAGFNNFALGCRHDPM